MPIVRCGDCGARPGTPHAEGCDVARCLWTGLQRIQCNGDFAPTVRFLRRIEELAKSAAFRQSLGIDVPEDMAMNLAGYFNLDDDHDCGQDIWTGEWPGEDDCRRLGWFQRGVTDSRRCGPDEPGAIPDLNRLQMEAVWNRQAKRWEARDGR